VEAVLRGCEPYVEQELDDRDVQPYRFGPYTCRARHDTLSPSEQATSSMASTGQYQLYHVFVLPPYENLRRRDTDRRYVPRLQLQGHGAHELTYPAGISQCKWNWYRKARKLDHMERLDSASRGSLGSVNLLYHCRPTQG
jgi:hypothetical protein